MRKLTVFNNITLDGFFTDTKNDMSAFHRHHDPEWDEYTSENASSSGNGTLLFGRKTYEMMKAFWPTAQARQQLPAVSEAMDRLDKVVVSRTMKDPGWTNARLLQGDLVSEVKTLKAGDGEPILIMGSGTIVSQLTTERLIDAYTIIIWPFTLGSGRTMFEDVEGIVDLKRVSERTFKNGNIVATYELAR
jgi:dihydrofolate reductase